MTVKNQHAGAKILEHDKLGLGFEDDIIEYRRAMEPDILKNIYETAQNAKDQEHYKDRNFYIVLLNVADRVLRTSRTVTVARLSCPTPTYKQSVWKYMHGSDGLEFLWSIPDSILYYHILHNKNQYLADKECSELAKFVILMESNELIEWVKKENGEKIDAVIKINKDEACLMS